jgi:hypothetical protein
VRCSLIPCPRELQVRSLLLVMIIGCWWRFGDISGTRFICLATGRYDCALVLARLGATPRTVSLGICAIRAWIGPDLRREPTVSDRERPQVIGVNGTLMARPRARALARPRRSGTSSGALFLAGNG